MDDIVYERRFGRKRGGDGISQITADGNNHDNTETATATPNRNHHLLHH